MWYWVLLAVVLAGEVWIYRHWSCDCGRERPWYYYAEHERAGVMLARAILVTINILLMFLVVSVWAVVFSLLGVWNWRRWWYHEKDKLKKKAAKLSGVVSFNQHGRLVVKEVKA